MVQHSVTEAAGAFHKRWKIQHIDFTNCFLQ